MNDGQYPEAEKLAIQAVAAARELGDRPDALPDHRALLAGALETHGETLVGQERQPEGIALYQDARDRRIALTRDFPDAPEFRYDEAVSRELLGQLLKDARQMRAAQAEYTAALQLRRSSNRVV